MKSFAIAITALLATLVVASPIHKREIGGVSPAPLPAFPFHHPPERHVNNNRCKRSLHGHGENIWA